jgi:hypothetical protein
MANPGLTRLMQAKGLRRGHLQSRTGNPGPEGPGHSRPEGQEFDRDEPREAARPKLEDQAALIVAGSIFTPGPIVEEIAMRLT